MWKMWKTSAVLGGKRLENRGKSKSFPQRFPQSCPFFVENSNKPKNVRFAQISLFMAEKWEKEAVKNWKIWLKNEPKMENRRGTSPSDFAAAAKGGAGARRSGTKGSHRRAQTGKFPFRNRRAQPHGGARVCGDGVPFSRAAQGRTPSYLRLPFLCCPPKAVRLDVPCVAGLRAVRPCFFSDGLWAADVRDGRLPVLRGCFPPAPRALGVGGAGCSPLAGRMRHSGPKPIRSSLPA